MNYEIQNTRIGNIAIGADDEDEAVTFLIMKCDYVLQGNFQRRLTPVIRDAFVQLNEYLEGRRRIFDLNLTQKGTDFQIKVWEAVKNIPYGETMSYGEIAEYIGMKGAARAVGGAVKMNRIPVFIPCHRVIAANHRLGGYSCGLELKITLLKTEGINFEPEAVRRA